MNESRILRKLILLQIENLEVELTRLLTDTEKRKTELVTYIEELQEELRGLETGKD